MTPEDLAKITQTSDGSPVKDLRWLSTDNVIVGLVKDELFGKEHINDGFIGGAWRRNGVPTNRIRGRQELTLKLKTND